MNKKSNKICCVTGHRNIPNVKCSYVAEQLAKEIESAIADGYNYFISGFADGTDLIFAKEIVNRIRNGQEFFLEAAIPYAGRLDSKDPVFQDCLTYCSQIHITSQKYEKNCFLDRNMYMLQKSQRVIAVYDGRKRGGTLYTINRAHSLDRDVRMIRI